MDLVLNKITLPNLYVIVLLGLSLNAGLKISIHYSMLVWLLYSLFCTVYIHTCIHVVRDLFRINVLEVTCIRGRLYNILLGLV